MRNVFMVSAMMLWSIGCGSGYKVLIVPLDEMDTLNSKAVILAVANEPKNDVEVEPDAVACKCGGTGRSGDGLGPCACPDGCKCKTNRTEAPVDVEEQPVVEEAVPEVKSDFQEVDSALTDAVTRLSDLSDKLVDNQVGFATKIEEFDARLKAIEQPAVKQETDAVEASPTKAIVNQLFVFTKMDGTCPPCTTFDEKEVPRLIDAGWSVGKDETYSVVLCDVTGDMSDVVRLRYEQFRKYGTPYFAYFKSGAFVKGYAGYRSATKIADDFISVINQQVSSSSVQQQKPNVMDRPTMVSKGDVWLYDTRKASRRYPSSRMTVPTFGVFEQGKQRLRIFSSNSL